ncbi:MAG TPA: hypothetical protein VGL77_07075, partial [Armatimonadota bacterium]
IAVQPFPVRHDAQNTFGFLISTRDRTLFHASDIGSYSAETLTRCQHAHAIAIESNYDPMTLQHNAYPSFLKARISGPDGHLSNPDAVQFLLHAISETTTNVFMLHLSENSNSRQLVSQQIRTNLQPVHQHIQYHISNRDSSLPLIEI